MDDHLIPLLWGREILVCPSRFGSMGDWSFGKVQNLTKSNNTTMALDLDWNWNWLDWMVCGDLYACFYAMSVLTVLYYKGRVFMMFDWRKKLGKVNYWEDMWGGKWWFLWWFNTIWTGPEYINAQIIHLRLNVSNKKSMTDDFEKVSAWVGCGSITAIAAIHAYAMWAKFNELAWKWGKGKVRLQMSCSF